MALRKTPASAVPLDLNQIIAEVVGLTYHEVEQCVVQLRTDLADALLPVVGDPVQMQQVLLHLVLNGLEAMRTVLDQPRELLIRSGHTQAHGVLVAVQDSGIGLDPQALERIFDPFFTTTPPGLAWGW